MQQIVANLPDKIQQIVSFLPDQSGKWWLFCRMIRVRKKGIFNPKNGFFYQKKCLHAMFNFYLRWYKTCFLTLLFRMHEWCRLVNLQSEKYPSATVSRRSNFWMSHQVRLRSLKCSTKIWASCLKSPTTGQLNCTAQSFLVSGVHTGCPTKHFPLLFLNFSASLGSKNFILNIFQLPFPCRF